MRILFVTARFPYPPLKGDQVRAYHQLRLLSRRHTITLLSMAEEPVPIDSLRRIGAYCDQMMTFPLRRMQQGVNLLTGLFSAYPLQTRLYWDPAFAQLVQQQADSGNFDLAHIQLARMAPYLENVQGIPRVIDLIDALSLNMERRYKRDKGALRLPAYLEWRRMRTYERVVCRKFDHVTVVSQNDREAIGNFPNLSINANGIDLQVFPYTRTGRDPRTIVFTGNMSYFPNVDAVCWFAQAVLPLVKQAIPDIRFTIAGANPDPKVQKLAEKDPAITVTGYVENIQAYLGQATLSVVPLQAGSGMQFKVIEAMASGTPLVVTPYALGGIDVTDGEHLLVAHDAPEFAAKLVHLLRDPQLQDHLACNARKLVEANYSWETTVGQLEDIYEALHRE